MIYAKVVAISVLIDRCIATTEMRTVGGVLRPSVQRSSCDSGRCDPDSNRRNATSGIEVQNSISVVAQVEQFRERDRKLQTSRIQTRVKAEKVSCGNSRE